MKISEFFLSVIATLAILQVIVICFIYDRISHLDYGIIQRIDSASIGTLRVDTISAQEIEIFPLMDLDGNIVE